MYRKRRYKKKVGFIGDSNWVAVAYPAAREVETSKRRATHNTLLKPSSPLQPLNDRYKNWPTNNDSRSRNTPTLRYSLYNMQLPLKDSPLAIDYSLFAGTASISDFQVVMMGSWQIDVNPVIMWTSGSNCIDASKLMGLELLSRHTIDIIDYRITTQLKSLLNICSDISKAPWEVWIMLAQR